MAGSTEVVRSVVNVDNLALAGIVANHYAANAVFADYLTRKAANTITAQLQDLNAFADYLNAIQSEAKGVELSDEEESTGENLQTLPSAWAGMTWGLIRGFVEWGVRRGFAISTINRRLSSVKVYCRLANQAGTIDDGEYMRIRGVTGYGQKDKRHINERRDVTRRSNKKSVAVRLGDEQATKLKMHPDTPQGRRDRLLMCLLLDHGLRAGEVAALKIEDFDQRGGFMYVDRPKVGIEDHRHKLSADTLRALRDWVESGDCPQSGTILRGSRKGGYLTDQGMSEISITRRVGDLGERIGVNGLSAHDCRHHWASFWAGRVDVLRLQEAGGWNSLEMPRRYVKRAEVANDGMA